MRDLSACRTAAQRALAFAVNDWDSGSAERARQAVNLLAITAVAVVLGADPVAARSFSARVLTSVPMPRFAEAPLFAALAAAAAALEVPEGIGAAEYVELLNLHAGDSGGDGNTALLRFALHGTAPGCHAPVALGLAPALLRSGNFDDLASVARTIETVSVFGTLPVQVADPFAALLKGAALSRFRAYDLPLAMRLTRAAHYLTPETDAALGVCTAFIHSSQGDDGAFGDYDTALATLARHGQSGAKSVIRCAVTLDALWTLAELSHPDCRLLRALFGDGGLSRAVERMGAATC